METEWCTVLAAVARSAMTETPTKITTVSITVPFLHAETISFGTKGQARKSAMTQTQIRPTTVSTTVSWLLAAMATFGALKEAYKRAMTPTPATTTIA